MSFDLPPSRLAARPASRRKLLSFMGLAGAAAVGSSLMPSSALALPFTTTNKQGRDVKSNAAIYDIVNFALNLEYLEAEFYLRAVTGSGLDAADVDSDIRGATTPGAVTGGRQVAFASPVIAQYAMEIAADETAHVKALRATLGKRAVARPVLNLETSFTAAAVAAGLITSGQTFDAFASDENFLLAAYLFEDVGVTAYRGAASSLNNRDILDAAAGILAVEAYHAGIIRTTLFAMGQTDPTVIAAANAISNARDAVDDPSVDKDQGITDANGLANLVPTDANGLAFGRTLDEVLHVVYLGNNPSPASFFPNGLNGKVA